MTESPLRFADGMRVGMVEFVAPDEIKVSLDGDAPDSVALNAGTPRPFPRANGYVLIPLEDGHLVGQVEWITSEKGGLPRSKGDRALAVIDLPYPSRRLSLVPLGTLRQTTTDFAFRRGAEALPSIGSPVLLPTDRQLRAIVESGARRRVRIGTSPFASDAEVRIDPDRLFGRHVAVLGNTGSGKSCTVAGLMRWSLEAAAQSRGGSPNARFVVLDPNGEYASAFAKGSSGPGARVFRVAPDQGDNRLAIPLWLWNSAEWAAFTQASGRAQRPLLKRALREIRQYGPAAAAKNAKAVETEALGRAHRQALSTIVTLEVGIAANEFVDDATKFAKKMRVSVDALRHLADNAEVDCSDFLDKAESVLDGSFRTFTPKGKTELVEFYEPFQLKEIEELVEALRQDMAKLGVNPQLLSGPDEDTPVPFAGSDLADHLELLAHTTGNAQYFDFLIARMRTMLSDARIASVIANDAGTTLEAWLQEYVGGAPPSQEAIAILDLSLVPSEVVHILAAVASRIVFEALQRYHRIYKVPLPTVLVMEEAHSFVKRYADTLEYPDTATVCCQVFERIAREGRKFGLGMVLSSQRPSELSPTVLSQCNTFLLHRISNDRDQELVHRLVPDGLRGLLRELPSLPSQAAIALGWAVELPVLVRIDSLPKEHRPRSDDPDFWDVWTGMNEAGDPVSRDANWKEVVREWQHIPVPGPSQTKTGKSVKGNKE